MLFICSMYFRKSSNTQILFLQKYKKWILKTIEDTWNLFQKKFLFLWNEHKGAGDAYPLSIYSKPELLERVQSTYMKDLFHDSIGFCAAKMIRLVVHLSYFVFPSFVSLVNKL